MKPTNYPALFLADLRKIRVRGNDNVPTVHKFYSVLDKLNKTRGLFKQRTIENQTISVL